MPTVNVTAQPGEEGTSDARFIFTIDDATVPFTLNYHVDGTAVADDEYVALPGVDQIAAGQTQLIKIIDAKDDLIAGGNKSVIAYVKPSPDYTIGPQSVATATITDNDFIRYVYKTLAGKKFRETVNMTMNEGHARTIQLELDNNALNRTVEEMQLLIVAMQLQITELQNRKTGGGKTK